MNKTSKLLKEIRMLERTYMKSNVKHKRHAVKALKEVAKEVKESFPKVVEKPTVVVPVTNPEDLAQGYKVRYAPNPKYKEPEEPLSEDLSMEETLSMLEKMPKRHKSLTYSDPDIRRAVARHNARQRFKAHMKELFDKGAAQFAEDMAKRKKVAVAYA